MIDWNIQTRAHVCQGCSKPFTDKQPYHTLLFDQRSAYARLDLCQPCWAGRESQPELQRGSLVSHWQGVFVVPPAAPPDPIQKDTAETLLRKLVALRDPRYIAPCFILAVMLERKRLLKVKAQDVHEGRRVIVYEDPRSGDLFTVPDPALRLDQLEGVQHEVMQLLQHGLPQTDPVAPGPPAAATGVPAQTPGVAALTEPSGLAAPGQASESPSVDTTPQG